MSNHEAGIGEGGKKKDSNSIGNLFYGSKGYMAMDGYKTCPQTFPRPAYVSVILDPDR
jgi:hypothetical protein